MKYWVVYHNDYGFVKVHQSYSHAQADAHQRNAEISDDRSNYHVVAATRQEIDEVPR